MEYFIIMVLLVILMWLGPVIDYFFYEFDIERLINIRLGYLYHRKYILLGNIKQLDKELEITFKSKKLDKLQKRINKIAIEYEMICKQIKNLKGKV